MDINYEAIKEQVPEVEKCELVMGIDKTSRWAMFQLQGLAGQWGILLDDEKTGEYVGDEEVIAFLRDCLKERDISV